MKKHPFRPSPTVNVRLSSDDLTMLLGCLAVYIEEYGNGSQKADLRTLVSLHQRFCILDRIDFDYAYVNGSVVNSRNPTNVIAQAASVAHG